MTTTPVTTMPNFDPSKALEQAAEVAKKMAAGPYVDALGLSLMGDNVLTRPPSGIVYGPLGSGKSTEVAKAFSNCLWLVSAGTVLRPYASYCRDNWAAVVKAGWRTPIKMVPDPSFDAKVGEYVWGDASTHKNLRNGDRPNSKTMPVERPWTEGGMAIKELPEYLPDGVTYADNWTLLSVILFRWCATSLGKIVQQDGNGNMTMADPAPGQVITNPYEGIVVDELNTLMVRVFKNMSQAADAKHPLFMSARGKQDTWAIPREFGIFVRRVFEIPRSTKKTLIGVSHEDPPKYEGEKPGAGKSMGDLKYQGGPAMPIGTTIAQISASVDFVLRTTITAISNVNMDGSVAPAGGSKINRKYWTEIDPLYFAKFRDFEAKPEEAFGLRALLLRAGYQL